MDAVDVPYGANIGFRKDIVAGSEEKEENVDVSATDNNDNSEKGNLEMSVP